MSNISLSFVYRYVFDPSEPVETVGACAAGEVTTLTQFFKANRAEGREGDEARKLTYQQFSHKFVWNVKEKKWTLRQ